MEAEDKASILIVDDLPDKLLVLRSILEGLGQNLVTATSGREALRRVLEQEFAVVLLDVLMPDMDGFETAALIRQRRQTAHTPIIFITAFADDLHTVHGYSLGAVDYIASPVVPEVLRAKVSVFVELYLKTVQVRRQAEQRVTLAREQAARAAAEEATRRASFLARASDALSGSLDLEATLRNLLRVVVPDLADLAGVTLLDEPGQPWQTELAWVVPPDEALHNRCVRGDEGPDDALRSAVERVLASGRSEVRDGLDVVYPPAPAAGPTGPSGRIRSALVLPLQARGRTLGVLALASGPSGRRPGADLALAEDLAGRAAVALDNARLYRDIEQADHRKDEFLAMLAHELRNPLAPARSALEILRAPGLPEAEAAWARDVIDRQVQLMARLVDDLLDVSRITRGKIALRAEPVEAAAVVARAVETTRPQIDAKRQGLSVWLPREPVWLRADAARLAQVFANLLNNASKFSEDGGRITLTAERHGDELVLRVRDSGVGIPANMLTNVFELFTQVDRSLDRSQGGLGIGLTLVKRLVEMHGGTVRAHSDGPGSGSEFTVRLPVLAVAPAGQDRQTGPVAPRGAGRRVLIADDNLDGAQSLGRLARLLGHEVRLCHDGPSALELSETFGPEVVLLDIGLPGMDGYEVARRLRLRPGADALLLVAVTGYGQEEDLRRSREAGFDLHLVKPIDPKALGGILAGKRPPANGRDAPPGN